MMLLKWVIRPYLYLRYHIERLTKTGAFGPEPAAFVKEVYQPTGHPVKDRLHQFHVKQFHESSCSVASVVSVINALKDLQTQKDKDQPGWQVLTQHDLLEKVSKAHWKERMSQGGYKGRRGLPLDILGQVVKASLDACQARYDRVETIQTIRHPDRITDCKNRLIDHLTRFEKKGDCVIIAHFDQGSFLTELHIPHISPVGGYDSVSQTVKILDVDSSQPYAYQVSFDRFYKGLSTSYNAVFRYFGYAEGGYVLIEL
jgi:hypothetical protein